MNQLENRQARYRWNTWMGRTRTDGPDEFQPSKFDCIFYQNFMKLGHIVKYHGVFFKFNNGPYCTMLSVVKPFVYENSPFESISTL